MRKKNSFKQHTLSLLVLLRESRAWMEKLEHWPCWTRLAEQFHLVVLWPVYPWLSYPSL